MSNRSFRRKIRENARSNSQRDFGKKFLEIIN